MEKGKIVRKFIIENIANHTQDIAMVLAQKFGFSRQRAHHYLSKEVKNGLLVKTGQTNGSKYFLANQNKVEFTENITTQSDEYKTWVTHVKPLISSCPKNIYDVCIHGFSEIFNNAIDHSEGTKILSRIEIKNNLVTIKIEDNGIGIFNKIKRELKLDNLKESILHLSKGKLTTDPSKHSGQGIFFTSRMFDRFIIISSNMAYQFKDKDFLLSQEKDRTTKGTLVIMEISLKSKKNAKEVFDEYSNTEDGFNKTTVSVQLSTDSGDPHVSRSQAKRLLIGLDKFEIIALDFKDVSSVGQAFIDEIFRVFQNEHPSMKILYINENKDTEDMIKRCLREQL